MQRRHLSWLAVLLVACGAESMPNSDTEGEGAPGGHTVPTVCTPAPLLDLDSIPDDPSLDPKDADKVAVFEVDGHDLIGKFVSDREAAKGGLELWREVATRIPENQLLDLVQLDIYLDTDPVAYFNRTGNVLTKRNGLKLGFSTKNFTINDPNPCAPLVPRRGTFDWSLVLEFGHLRGWLDESWFKFLDTFPDVRGPGDGYPEDGSPTLTGDFVTSYAERADGDEDYAESWTTYVMLDALPPERADEPLALKKVRWVSKQPGLEALRAAIRISEADGGGVAVPAAPRKVPKVGDDEQDGETVITDVLAVPPAFHGTWGSILLEEEGGETEYRFTFSADDVVEVRLDGSGREVSRQSLKSLLAAGSATLSENVVFGEVGYGYNAVIEGGELPLEDSFFISNVNGVDYLFWTRLGGREHVVLGAIPGRAGGPGGPIDPIDIPSWLIGTFEATYDGVTYRFVFSAHDIEEIRLDSTGVELGRIKLSERTRGAMRLTTEQAEGYVHFGYNTELPDLATPFQEDFWRAEGTYFWARLDLHEMPSEMIER